MLRMLYWYHDNANIEEIKGNETILSNNYLFLLVSATHKVASLS